MRNVIIGALAALLLSLSLSAKPAEATPAGYFYLPQYTYISLTYKQCTVEFVYGVYGNTSFGNITATSGGCEEETGVQLQSWGKTSSPCSYAIENRTAGYPDCDVFNGGSTLQAVTPGYPGLLGGIVRLVNNPFDYVIIKFSPIP